MVLTLLSVNIFTDRPSLMGARRAQKLLFLAAILAFRDMISLDNAARIVRLDFLRGIILKSLTRFEVA